MESCLNMTFRQLIGLYHESFIVEAKEQLRTVYANKMGHPHVDSKKYIDNLSNQADPPDEEDALAIGVKGFEQARLLFGKEIRG